VCVYVCVCCVCVCVCACVCMCVCCVCVCVHAHVRTIHVDLCAGRSAIATGSPFVGHLFAVRIAVQ